MPDNVKITVHGQTVTERSLTSKIFSGDAGCLWNIVCCPVVMTFHSFRVYCFSCGWIYFTWAFDKVHRSHSFPCHTVIWYPHTMDWQNVCFPSLGVLRNLPHHLLVLLRLQG